MSFYNALLNAYINGSVEIPFTRLLPTCLRVVADTLYRQDYFFKRPLGHLMVLTALTYFHLFSDNNE